MRMKVSGGTRPVTEPESWLNCGEWPSTVKSQETATFSFPEEGKKTMQSGRTLDF